MRLVRALIACTGSRTLPALERPRVVSLVWCRGRGGTGANDCPVSPVPRTQGHASVLGLGWPRPSGLVHGHRVAPRGPVRCEAVGRSELSKPGGVEATGWQGGVSLFQQRCEASAPAMSGRLACTLRSSGQKGILVRCGLFSGRGGRLCRCGGMARDLDTFLHSLCC